MTENTAERVARPEESIVDAEERTDEQRPRPLRCHAGSKTPDGGCQRDATVWMYPEDRNYPVCDEHARLYEVADEANDWSLIQEITNDWLRMAQAWRLEELEQLAINANEHAKLEYLKAHAKAELAEEIANTPRWRDARIPAEVKPEEREELIRRRRRSDELNNAYTTLEDIPEGQIREEAREAMLAVLVEERERANREFREYRRELGLLEPESPVSN